MNRPPNDSATILLNLGTPEAPTPKAVGRYLVEFLTDPDVITAPTLIRHLLVRGLIVPRRKYKSAHAYSKIWTDRGSPLLFNTQDLVEKVASIFKQNSNHRVVMAMRYGNPSIASVSAKLLSENPGLKKILIAPLYPQAAAASTDSSIKECRRVLARLKFQGQTLELPAFYADNGYLDCFAERGRSVLNSKPWDHVIFSFHGLPEAAMKRADRSGGVCLKSESCSDPLNAENQFCYRAQSHATAHGIAQKLGLRREQYSIGFQSRLGLARWIHPYLDTLYAELPKKGIRRAVIFSPAFVADCLETLEELTLRGRESWIAAGGTDLTLVPSLNSGDDWAAAVARMIEREVCRSTPRDQQV